ncbi:MAG TPA: alkaline phosphatase family protein [Acidimicrobiales bacterium]|nr:alkaline phosphatase family protein [Acidimicrobiales bacterium]
MTTRRRFLQGAAAAGAWTMARPYANAWASPVRAAAALPDPATAPFDHVVVLMFENRSFDHLLGWLPGADGKQAGLQFADQTGTVYPTYELAPDPQGCGYLDPDHSWEGFVVQHNGGANDGWLRTPSNRGIADTFPIGFYTEPDVPALSSLAKSYTVLDRYFASFAGETFPNRFYQHAARTDRDHNMGVTATNLSPTIWDRLAAANLSAGYYYSDEPFILLWGAKYASIAHPVAQFLADAAAGTLPNVSFVDPSFANEGQGQSGDYHPHGDIRAGEAFLAQIYHAVRSSPAWDRTVLVVNFDEWGGFYDHVVPPRVTDDTVRAALTPAGAPVPDYQQLGFRVPCIVASPFSPAKVVSDGPYEHTSVLKMIEWRWGLAPLTQRDANANNLAEVLDFSNPRTDEPDVPTLTSFASIACGLNSVAKQPPQPLYVPPGAATTDTTAPSSNSSSSAGGTALPRTGASVEPLLVAGAAAISGGMALRAAYRKLHESEVAEAEVAEAG